MSEGSSSSLITPVKFRKIRCFEGAYGDDDDFVRGAYYEIIPFNFNCTYSFILKKFVAPNLSCE